MTWQRRTPRRHGLVCRGADRYLFGSLKNHAIGRRATRAMEIAGLCLVAVVLMLPAGHASAAPVLVVDEDMSAGPGAFDSFFFSVDETDGNLSIDQQASGSGNPGDALEILHFYDPVFAPDGNPDGYDIQSVHVYQLASHNPSTQGIITDVSFSIDVENSGPMHELFFTISDANGGEFLRFQELPSTNGFETLTADNVDNTEASSRDFAGSEPIFFGFGYTSLAPGDGTDEFLGDQYSVVFDNFRVTIQTVPEPSSLLCLSLIGGGILVRRRR